MHRHRLFGLFAILVLLIAFTFGSLPTRADTTGKSGDRLATISASISTTASVVAGVTGRPIRVKSMLVRSDTAGVVAFQDGSGGTTLANVYLEANKPFIVDESVLGDTLVTTSGNGLYAVLSGATLTATVRYTHRLE